MTIEVSQLFRFPVKSLKGSSLEKMQVDAFGPRWDRRFMLANQNGRFLTQREFPIMGQFGAEINADSLQLTYAGVTKTLSLVKLSRFAQHRSVSIWKDEVSARLIESDINPWLSDILQTRVTLCFMDDDTHRQVDTQYALQGDRTSFADGYPFLIISEASIEFLSEKVGRELSVERFRPNVVLTGCEAFAEDEWTKIAINGIEFDVVKPCARCSIPTLNLKTSEKEIDVMQMMLKHRRQGKAVMMGQNAIHRQHGVLQVGQAVEVLEY